MAWSFVDIVDEQRVADIGNLAVHELRGRFTDGTNILCLVTYFYSNPYAPPTNPQKAARRDEILSRLNEAALEINIIDEYIDELRQAYRAAREAGRTKAEILAKIRQAFKELIDG